MRCVLFGSSEFAVPSLSALAREHELIAVYTQPDRPAGRGLKLTPTPVKAAASSAGLTVVAPDKLDAKVRDAVARLNADVLACVSYGKILPAALLETPTLAALNVHPSLLPAYRGATPIQAALRDGLTRTGVSVIWMTPRMDAGDVAMTREVEISPNDDFESLHDRLAAAGASALLEALAALADGTLPRVPQNEARATYTFLLRKDDTRLSFARDARDAVNLVRSLSPKPGAWTELEGRRVKVLHARAEEGAGEPGSLLALGGDGPLIACARGAVRLLRVVPEGKPPMSGADFARALERRA